MIDPHKRQRNVAVLVRPTLRQDLSNQDLHAAFCRSLTGKYAPKTIERFTCQVRDALAYFTRDGVEIPVSTWRKETVWEYVHYAESNYCRYFGATNMTRNSGVYCRKKVWQKVVPVEEGTKHCSTCPLFEASREAIEDRLNALNAFFRFLARSGVVETNFVRDILTEYYEDLPDDVRRERRRNPSVEEMVRLVNGTFSIRNRAFYAASAKWGYRLNEMLALDRYTSLPNFDDGGDLVLLPTWKGALDKRKGNRASVVDAELRPILEQYLAWWERAVRRDADGKPLTTKLWLTEHGRELKADSMFYEYLFYPDCERLGLMTRADRDDPLRRWTAHCQRHFMEKVLMMTNCPDTWSKHFRGDIIKDARAHYFVPTPEQIREKYLELMPKFGFLPLPEMAAGPRVIRTTDDAHGAVLLAGLARVEAWKNPAALVLTQRIVELDRAGKERRTLAYVPRRSAPSFLAAHRRQDPGLALDLRPDADAPVHGRVFAKDALRDAFHVALAALGHAPAALMTEKPPPAVHGSVG